MPPLFLDGDRVHHGQSPWPDLKARDAFAARQVVPLFVQIILPPVAGFVGVSTMVRFTAGEAVSVAPVVAVMIPFTTVVPARMFFVTAVASVQSGMPLVPELQPVRVPVSARHIATAILVESSSAIAPAALVREV